MGFSIFISKEKNLGVKLLDHRKGLCANSHRPFLVYGLEMFA